MFNFSDQGAEEVITQNRGVLRVYGFPEAKYSGKDNKKNLSYLKNRVVNHTYY
jgi:hypothetical protein